MTSVTHTMDLELAAAGPVLYQLSTRYLWQATDEELNSLMSEWAGQEALLVTMLRRKYEERADVVAEHRAQVLR